VSTLKRLRWLSVNAGAEIVDAVRTPIAPSWS
jgi:hypothetical protein